MACRNQKKFCCLILLSLLGLILEVIVFSSPSWAIFKFPVNPDGSLKALGGTIAGYEYADDTPFEEDKCATLSLGLWKVEPCSRVADNDDDYYGRKKRDHGYGKNGYGSWNKWERKCFSNRYGDDIKEKADELPERMTAIKQMNKHIGITAHLGLTEYQVETVIGLAAAVVGQLAAIMYVRTSGKKGSIGILCCLCLLTSGVLYWTAIGKIHTTISQMRALIIVLKMVPVQIPTPWCLITGGIAATIELIAGILAMGILSLNNKKEETPQELETTNEPIGQATGTSTTVMDVDPAKMAYVLPEYEADPPPYDAKLSKAEEAGLPADKF